ncbi:MAG TPA: M20/M25/M40 family metallo-hydrolase, partial [Candidatus Acidoferrales bacterium]|nr:M20/M25/M40 family metallo-hydrolase [Candidatus Acidoferrales bacterium]
MMRMAGEPSGFLPRAAAVLWILLLGGVSLALFAPRGVVPATAPPDQFSAERALRHVQEIARAPHPLGSADHPRVRDYLLHQLSSLGLDPSVQKTMAVLPAYGTAATVENVLARKHGTGGGGPALLLAAHYDSVPAGPGAGDDGAGAATLLETARALGAGPPLRNDVIFLFTDGEELGLLGASAFVKEHPWKSDVGVALNFDNRGTRGAVLMYETSPGDLALLRELAAVVRSPRASS